MIKLDENKIQDACLDNAIKSITHETVKLDNGAEGYIFSLSGDELEHAPSKGQNGKYPMITLIDGELLSSSPADTFLQQRLFLVLQGYHVLVVNHRGARGFGKDFMDELLGELGNKDMHDCANLTKAAMQTRDIDEKRLCVEGSKHGGFVAAWLVVHADYKDLWCAASFWNAFTNLHMLTLGQV